MRNQSRQGPSERHNVYSGYFPNNHNRLGSRRIMFNVSGALQRTRSSNPSPDYLAPHGLTWSDINRKVDWKAEALEGAAFLFLFACLMLAWLVLPELVAA